ncbi:mycothiol acetyltransferase [Oxobacter pfennigii]|uniref:Mycothiol acetyltransferase n=1 Tax=Oxobacter pfennigii TaxID=36849 RepID=A0A0P8WQN3_9CLOT|nr:GNAT family N-acetyltransferase [Oxobacter pfennigii]KPU44853.1 mycothiol acetyltransferase [Oxobacter pfennigii]
MVKVEKYNDNYTDSFNRLYSMAHGNTRANSDILSNNKLKIKLLKISQKIKGYILYKDIDDSSIKDRVHIEDIFIEKNYCNKANYTYLLESINKGFLFKKYKTAQIFLDKSKPYFEISDKLNLSMDQEIYDMKIFLNGYKRVPVTDNVSFKTFKKGRDEYTRMWIQNDLFKGAKGHKDFNIEDVLHEQKQIYFLEEGCIFLKYNDEIAGYAQVIYENHPDTKPYIVNFGIITKYRGLGLSKLLLNHTLNFIKRKDFNEAYVTVDSSNKKALRLYRKTGFSKIGSLGMYLYNYNSSKVSFF